MNEELCGEPQIYGTQYLVRDADRLEERRAALGLASEQVNRVAIMAAEGLTAGGAADDPPAAAGNPDQL